MAMLTHQQILGTPRSKGWVSLVYNDYTFPITNDVLADPVTLNTWDSQIVAHIDVDDMCGIDPTNGTVFLVKQVQSHPDLCACTLSNRKIEWKFRGTVYNVDAWFPAFTSHVGVVASFGRFRSARRLVGVIPYWRSLVGPCGDAPTN